MAKKFTGDLAEIPPIDFAENETSWVAKEYLARSENEWKACCAANWIIAIDSWDLCDPRILELMIKTHPIPEELREIIADITSGARTPNKRAAAKLQFPAAHRLVLASLYLELKQTCLNVIKPENQKWFRENRLKTLSDIADDNGVEVIEQRKYYMDRLKEFRQKWAGNMKISPERLDDYCDELKQKIKNYPNI